MRRRTRKKPVLQEKAEPYLYLLPTIVLFVFILAVPLFNLFKYSLGDSNIIQGFKGWNGFQNFAYLVSPKFLGSMWVTIVYVFFGVIGVVVCGTIVSLALDKPIPGRGVFRAIAIIPWVVPQAFAASMWSWVVNAQFGFINQLLRSMHLIENNLSFLSEHTALATVIVVRIWQGTPFMIISLLAALQTIPEDIQEAADLDGVTAFQRFRFITLPYIKPVLVTTTLIITAWTMQIFDTVYIMTAGGPARSTQLVALEIYAKAFQQDDLGTACAIALCVLGIIALLSLNNLKKERGGTWNEQHQAEKGLCHGGALWDHPVLDAVYPAAPLHRLCGLADRIPEPGKDLFVPHRLGLAQLCRRVYPGGYGQLFKGYLYLRGYRLTDQRGAGHLCGLRAVALSI